MTKAPLQILPITHWYPTKNRPFSKEIPQPFQTSCQNKCSGICSFSSLKHFHIWKVIIYQQNRLQELLMLSHVCRFLLKGHCVCWGFTWVKGHLCPCILVGLLASDQMSYWSCFLKCCCRCQCHCLFPPHPSVATINCNNIIKAANGVLCPTLFPYFHIPSCMNSYLAAGMNLYFFLEQIVFIQQERDTSSV